MKFQFGRLIKVGCGLSFCIQHDGFLLAKKRQDKEDDKNIEALKAARRCSEFALAECPTLIQFLGYSFCMSNVLVSVAGAL